MPGGRGGSGRGGGFGRGQGRGGRNSGSSLGNALEPFVGIGESIIKGIAGRKAGDDDLMSIQPVGDPVRVREPESRQPLGANSGFPQVEKDLSVRAEMNILKDQVGRIGDLLLKINNRLDSLENAMKPGEKEDEAAKEEDAE